jgi:hypothetical protein
MAEQTKELAALVTKLPRDERIAPVEEFPSSLNQPDAAINRLWAREVDDRLAAH